MKAKVFLAWYDLWIGAYWDAAKRRLYICPLPCCVILLDFAYMEWCKLLGHKCTGNNDSGYDICDRCGAHAYWDYPGKWEDSWFWPHLRLWWRLHRWYWATLGRWWSERQERKQINKLWNDDDIPF